MAWPSGVDGHVYCNLVNIGARLGGKPRRTWLDIQRVVNNAERLILQRGCLTCVTDHLSSSLKVNQQGEGGLYVEHTKTSRQLKVICVKFRMHRNTTKHLDGKKKLCHNGKYDKMQDYTTSRKTHS